MTRTVLPILWLAACGLGAEPGAAPSADPGPSSEAEVLATRAVQDTASDPLAVGDTASPSSSTEEPVAATEPAGPPPEVEAWSPDAQSTTWTVRRGETLAHFARWSELPVEAVAAASGHALTEPLAVGAEVRVPVDEQVRARVEQARDAHHRRRAHGYLAGRGGAHGTDFYTVRTGDTAWSVARDEVGVPVWLLETYNPSVDLGALRPGQRLMVPVLADTTADAGAATPDSSEAP